MIQYKTDLFLAMALLMTKNRALTTEKKRLHKKILIRSMPSSIFNQSLNLIRIEHRILTSVGLKLASGWEPYVKQARFPLSLLGVGLG